MKTCWLCPNPLEGDHRTGEHIIPSSIGGRKEVHDFICRSCNSTRALHGRRNSQSSSSGFRVQPESNAGEAARIQTSKCKLRQEKSYGFGLTLYWCLMGMIYRPKSQTTG